MENKKYVIYEEFGAIGDGEANDFVALFNAHNYANEKGLAVKADETKTYRISDTRIDGKVEIIKIRTDAVWGNANFLIDDSALSGDDGTGMMSRHIFEVISDYDTVTIEDPEALSRLAGLAPGAKKIDLKLGYPAMIIPYNHDHRVYRRRGSSYSGAGAYQHEVLVIDGEGNISPETPVMFSYEKVTKVVVFRTDMPAITIDGGIVTTKAPRHTIYKITDKGEIATKTGYIKRGMYVTRSNTVIRNLKHYVTNEVTVKEALNSNFLWSGAYYSGFFISENADHITYENCVMSGRRCYRTPAGLIDYNGIMGTYDFNAAHINNVRLIGCSQHNFYVRYDEERDELVDASPDEPGAINSMDMLEVDGKKTRMYWGLGGTNFCKNVEYINTQISRFDAHAGLYNGKVSGCTINAISVVGQGEFIVENTRFISGGKGPVNNSFFYLRDDYGATWDGDMLIKNCTVDTTEDYFYIANITWGNWDYGYKCYIPNIMIDGLTINAKPETKIDVVSRGALNEEPALWCDTLTDGRKNDNKVTAPAYLKVLNNNQGTVYHLIDSPMFENTDITGIVRD